MTTPATHDVIVHKANVPMMKGESLYTFMEALRNAGRAFLMQKYNVDSKKGSVYPIEVYADKAVFKVTPDYEKPVSNDFCVAVKFNRDTNGTFTFTDTMKVVPVTTYVAASEINVTKAMGMPNWVKGGIFTGVV